MSCVGVVIGLPLDGEKMLFGASMISLLSICASMDSGTCTAIWSPSKSALYAVQTSGWMRMASPSISTGSNAWIERRCSVGARFSITVWPRVTSSRISQTWSSSRSIIFLALRTVCTTPIALRRRMMKGSNSTRAIFLGRPHWFMRRLGPMTITERPE